jgi:Mg2+-importing ATPase
MAFFGPISSVYDFLTFAVMLRVFDAGPSLFQSGWFVESLTTQTLVIFVIPTRRLPFLQEPPQPTTPHRHPQLRRPRRRHPLHPANRPPARLRALPASFLAVLAGMIITYLAQIGVALFFKHQGGPPPRPPRQPPTTTHQPHSLTLASLATQTHNHTAHAGTHQLTGERFTQTMTMAPHRRSCNTA